MKAKRAVSLLLLTAAFLVMLPPCAPAAGAARPTEKMRAGSKAIVDGKSCPAVPAPRVRLFYFFERLYPGNESRFVTYAR